MTTSAPTRPWDKASTEVKLETWRVTLEKTRGNITDAALEWS